MTSRLLIVSTLAASLLGIGLPASADPNRPPDRGGHQWQDQGRWHDQDHWRGNDHWRGDGERRWHGGDIRHFREHDAVVWRGGRWYHGWHGGQLGWWWLAAGSWYFYNAPIYPYPDPYTPAVIVVQQPSATYSPPPPVVGSWYYCDSSQAYYPYVAGCPEGWRVVPATPLQ